jgi:NADH-quinone oxidoreductase subunit F
LERSKWDALKVDSNTLATNIAGIFAGGDFVTGPTFVIEAIAAGRRGAVAIDKYLRGEAGRVELIEEREEVPPEVLEAELEEVAKEKPRVQVPLLPPEVRVKGFAEIELGFSEEKAQEEANRCLRCDLER